jgi:DNA polymerase III alpha subunit
MKMEYFERGSEWRKWDLHLHTPSSFDYDNNSVTNEEIIETLKSNGISAAVITDHHYIDVDRITELVELGKDAQILILPGIELRSELGGSEAIHFIGIFPNEDLDNVWDDINIKLEIKNKNNEKDWDKKVFSKIEKACKLFHELGGITSIHAGTKSNSIENIKNNKTNQYLHKLKQKEYLLKEYIDILEIGKEEDIKTYEEIVFPDIKTKNPLIIGSDNHNIRDYTLKQNCWIKSDLTFEGLKQIIYEPEERVKIQETRPDEKNEYEVIDSVRFESDKFLNSEIVLNSNLVSIIGGRSTGKSIFLRSIARAIDEDHVKDVCADISDL